MKRDLTTGSISRNLLYMSIPAILGNLARTLYDIIDMIWIGRISATAVAGVTVFSSIFWMIWVLSVIIGVSSVSLVSQSYGAGDKKQTARIIEQTLFFKALVAIVTMCIALPSLRYLVHFMSKDPAVIETALQYGTLRLLFLPVMFSSVTVTSSMRSMGDSRKPMYLMLTASIMNIILDPILMFETIPFIGLPGFNLGVFGAALATVISDSIVFIIGLWILFSGRSYVKLSLKTLFKLNKSITRKLTTIGLPTGVEVLARDLSNFLVMKVLSSFGTNTLAALGICFRFLGFAFMPLFGLHDAGSAVIGQNLGAEKIDRAKKTSLTIVWMSLSISIAAILLVEFNAPMVMRLFVVDAHVIQTGAILLRIIIPGLIFCSIAFGIGSVFPGSGYNLPWMICGIASRWGIQLPWMLISALWFKLSFTYVVLGYLLSDLAEMVIILYFYKQGKWRHHRVVEQKDNLQPKTSEVASS